MEERGKGEGKGWGTMRERGEGGKEVWGWGMGSERGAKRGEMGTRTLFGLGMNDGI
jgi:hypothetical protein